MSLRVDTVVMAHRKRQQFVAELLAALDRPAKVVWDAGDNNRWNTGRRAWQAADRTATHGMVIQDDAIVCRNLVAGVEEALSHVPDESPLCLYTGRVRPFRDLIQQLVDQAGDGTAWLTMGQIHWGVGIVLPTRYVDDMLAWCDQRTDVANYDRRISRWCQHMGLTVYYPWPSLVDHRESPSLVPGRSYVGRRAHQFIGAGEYATSRNWSGEAISIPALRYSTVHTSHGAPQVAVPVRPRRPKLGVPVKFVSSKYPQLQVPAARVRFRDGEVSTTDADAIDVLTSPQLRAMGVEPVGEEPAPAEPAEETSQAEDASQGEATGTEPADAEPAAESEAQEPAAEQGGVPAGGAKDVLAWVGDDPGRARQALEVEQAREKPRTTLVATLTKLAG